MKRLLLTVATVLICSQAALSYWPTTDVTRESAREKNLPLKMIVTDLADGTVRVSYEVTLAGPFACLQRAEVVVTDGDQLLLQHPVATPAVCLPDSGDGTEPIKGEFRVSKRLLDKCRLSLECPIEPLHLSGQTFSVDLVSYHQ